MVVTARETELPRPLHLLPEGDGGCFPEWLDRADPEARLGEKTLRTMDDNLRVGYDRRYKRYLIWGWSLSRAAYVPIMRVMDDNGVPFRSPVPWRMILLRLRQAREQALYVDEVRERNLRYEEQLKREHSQEFVDACRFGGRAIRGELEGWGRWQARDVLYAYDRQTHGTKLPPEGKVISVPHGR